MDQQQAIYDRESHNFNRKFFLNVATLTFIFVMNVLRGNGVDLSVVGAKKCNTQDYVLLAVVFVGILFFSIVGHRIVNAEIRYKKFIRYNLIDGDVQMDQTEYRNFSAFGLFGGMMAGGSGLGAVLFFTPIVLAYGVHPMVTAESGNFMSLFSATTSTITVIILRKLKWEYALLINSIALIVTYPGARIQEYLLKKYARPSMFVAGLLAFVTFVLLAVPAVSIYNMVKQKRESINVMDFTPYC